MSLIIKKNKTSLPLNSILEGDIGTVFRVWQSEQYPDVLSLIDKRSEPIGLIPVQLPQSVGGRSGQWTVGVDFGTSFTNLHVSRAGARERLDLSMLTLNITNKPENNASDTTIDARSLFEICKSISEH